MCKLETLSSFLPAFFGFLTAIAMFVFQEWFRDWLRNRRLRKCLKFELNYNLKVLAEFRNHFENLAVTTGRSALTDYAPENRLVAHHFSKRFYESGLLAKYFTHTDMADWNLAILATERGAATMTIDDYISRVEEASEITENLLKKLS